MAEDDEVIFIGVSQTTVVSGGKHAIRACLNKVIEQLSTAVRNAKNLKHDFEYSLNEIPSSTMELFLNEQTQHVCNLMRNVETSFDEVRTILNAKLLLNSPLECEKKLEERPSSSSTTEENRMNLKTSHDVADGKSKQAEVDSPGDPNPGCSIDHTSEITSAKQQSCKESSNDAVESFARHVSELSHDSAKRSGAEAMSENGCEIELEGASSVTEKDTTLSANTAERNELVEDEVPTHEESAESNHHAETEFKAWT